MRGPRHRHYYRLHLRFLTLLHYTGVRRCEIFYLPWANIALDEKCIYIRSHALFTLKERREKVLPTAPSLHAFLTTERQNNLYEAWLLDDGNGKSAYANPHAITLAFRRHLAALGFAGRGVKPIHGHRAAMAHRLWNSGVDLSTVQATLGHSNIAVTQSYLPSTIGRVQAAVGAFEGVEVHKILSKMDTQTDTKAK